MYKLAFKTSTIKRITARDGWRNGALDNCLFSFERMKMLFPVAVSIYCFDSFYCCILRKEMSVKISITLCKYSY
jgi:hypothetical protein